MRRTTGRITSAIAIALAVGFSSCGPTRSDFTSDDTGSTSGTPPGTTTPSTSGTSTSGVTSAVTTAPMLTSTSTSTSGTTGLDTTETGDVGDFFECHPIDQEFPCTERLPHCVPSSVFDDDEWTGTRCIAEGNDENGVGSPCSIPNGPITGQRDCAKGLACAAADVDATEGVCVRLCLSSNHCPDFGQCYPCSADNFRDRRNPIGAPVGVCLEDLDCPNDPACAVAGCWPVFP